MRPLFRGNTYQCHRTSGWAASTPDSSASLVDDEGCTVWGRERWSSCVEWFLCERRALVRSRFETESSSDRWTTNSHRNSTRRSNHYLRRLYRTRSIERTITDDYHRFQYSVWPRFQSLITREKEAIVDLVRFMNMQEHPFTCMCIGDVLHRSLLSSELISIPLNLLKLADLLTVLG